MAQIEVSRGMRLDQYVVEKHPRLSRSYAVRLIEGGQVLVNGTSEKPGYKIRQNDAVTIDFDESALDVIPDIDLPVIYEDENVIVVNKPAGVISHARGRYWDEPSVASFVRSRVASQEEWADQPGQPTRAGIVHRLDRATSGVMICAKNPATLKYLQKQFGDRTVKKKYMAIVTGHLSPEEAIIDIPIERNPNAPSTFRPGAQGKPAQTHYIVVKRVPHYDQVELSPMTGRTHQLRVHLSHVGHSIVGDTLYGGQEAERLYLHAQRLEITLPGGLRTVLEAPLPEEFNVLVAS